MNVIYEFMFLGHNIIACVILSAIIINILFCRYLNWITDTKILHTLIAISNVGP